MLDSSKQEKADYLIIGAGILGLMIAKKIRESNPKARIVVLEKERNVACHASGRNSGVLHAGFYYHPKSLKARFCREGNFWLQNYCQEKGIPLKRTGKVVVAKDENELETLELLYERGKANGVEVRMVDEKELSEIEPVARTVEKALYSPSTATVDPVSVCKSLRKELEGRGVVFCFSEGYRKRISQGVIETTLGRRIEAQRILNCAGLYADKIAKDFGFSKEYEILPFKGIYLYTKGLEGRLSTHIYPVPDLQYPFLGVHFTLTVEGKVKVGPTAIPAFWRENYQGLANFRFSEILPILGWCTRLFLTNSIHFRDLALEEWKKYSQKYLLAQSKQLLKQKVSVSSAGWSRPGIRAQLLDCRRKELVSDF
ncbi:MAG: L-2-hydroxyglutarate oxidase, partial [Planctomycetota bacterium]